MIHEFDRSQENIIDWKLFYRSRVLPHNHGYFYSQCRWWGKYFSCLINEMSCICCQDTTHVMETGQDCQEQEMLPAHRSVSQEEILHEVSLISPDKDSGDCSGSHSSEEELEEINTNKKTYVERVETERDCKRKWTETDLSQSDTSSASEEEFEDPELKLEVRLRLLYCLLLKSQFYCQCTNGIGVGERSTSTSTGSCCDTPSGDEADQPLATPVQFSTSPPVDVHKPRRSLSPPPKLFGLQAVLSNKSPVTQPRSSLNLNKLGQNLSSSLGDLSQFDPDNDRKSGKKTISPRSD